MERADEHGPGGLRDPARPDLVRAAARATALRPAAKRSASLAALAAAAALAACGGDDDGAAEPRLAWDGTPVVRSSPTGSSVLIGKVRNESSGELRITAPQVKVVDGDGRPIASSATFVSAYVRSNYPQNRGALSRPAAYPEAEQRRVGYLAVLGSGDRTALTVSWREPRGRAAKRVVYDAASLPIPAASAGER